jgi:hypothetical protein
MTLLPVPRQRYFDDNGDPLSGGKLYTYIAGTTTPLATYVDASGDTPNTNPIILDSNGECDVFVGSSVYKFVLTDADDVIQWTRDNISAGDSDELSEETDSGWSEHAITDGQSATDLVGQTVDLSLYSSKTFEVEIIRGTTVNVKGEVEVYDLDGTGDLALGAFKGAGPHGVTFSVSQAGTVVTLRAATSSGPGAGTIKLNSKSVPV